MMAQWHEAIFPACEELNIAFVSFSPMANGFLTGKYTPETKFEGKQDYRAGMPQYTQEGYEKAKALLELLIDSHFPLRDAADSFLWHGCSVKNLILFRFPAPESRSACGRTLKQEISF